MFSRGTGSDSPGPRRAKSSSCISLRPAFLIESSNIEPDVLHKHALTAANLAYERASGFFSANKGAAKADVGQEMGPSEASKDQPAPDRTQSIRFAGPNAKPLMTRSITRREAPPSSATHEFHSPSVPSRTTSCFPNDDSLMAQPGEFGENDIASMQSSYRKLRKAKSMFSPGKAPSTVFSGGTLGSKRHFQRHSWQSNTGSEERFRVSDPRLRRSYSFLRGVTDRITTSNCQYATHDAAIQLARDTYLKQLEEQRLKQQPLFLSIGKRRKSQKPFHRTVRSTSTNSYGTAVASPMASVELPKVSIGQKARSLSQTLKKKIKRIFHRSTDDPSNVPAQHLSASHIHYRDYATPPTGLSHEYSPVPEPDAELIRRVSSRESKEQDVPVYVDEGSRPDSVRSVSMHSNEDGSNDRSRVTSWTNSTAANTITTRPQMMERKRLSIIKEDGGPYQPSSPSRRYGSLNDEHARFRQSVRQKNADRMEAERIYSALQRKIDEHNRKADFEEEPSTGDYCEQHSVQRTMSTPTKTSTRRQGADLAPITLAQEPDSPTTYPNYQQDYAEVLKGLTPQEIAKMNESGLPPLRGPLREVKSTFFPPSMRIERRSTSPFRRVMKASSEDGDSVQTNADPAGQPRSSSHVNLSKRRLNRSIAGSGSIYSRSPGGHTVVAVGSSLSLAGSESSSKAGTAIIHTIDPAKDRSLNGPSIGRRYSSAELSETWKRFMADQVASLENLPPPNDQIENIFPLRECGHKREEAQIDGDNVSIGRQQGPKDLSKQPLGIIQTNTNSHLLFKHKVVSPTSRENTFMRTSSFPNMNPTTQNENNPFIQRPSYPRKTSMSDVISGLRQKQSQALLASQKDQKGVPSNPNVRHNSERVERLRRLKNSSSTSLLKASSQKEDDAADERCTTSPSLWQHVQDSDDSDTSFVVSGDNVVGRQKMVERFLKGRRSDTRISEESGTDPAFL